MSKTTKTKLATLRFAEKHGVSAALDYSKICRSTFYLWKKNHLLLGDSGLENRYGYAAKRQRLWPPELIKEIRAMRNLSPNLGPDKLVKLLPEWCHRRGLTIPSRSTIARLIADETDKMRIKPIAGKASRLVNRTPVLRKPKGLQATHLGECVAFDTIIRIVGGRRVFIHVGIDLYSRMALAVTDHSGSADSSAKLFRAIQHMIDQPIKKVLTDNGSEFKKAFRQTLAKNGTTHLHTYPKKPQMNAHCERFNRTLWEEFAVFQRQLLFGDLQQFNLKLVEWLLWYNFKRPHYAHKQLAPAQFLRSNQESKTGWDYTIS